MMYTLSKELEQELVVSAPELQASYTAIVEYLEAISQKEASGRIDSSFGFSRSI